MLSNRSFRAPHCVLWLAALLALLGGNAGAGDVQEYTVKAALTLNFVRFSEWPAGTFKTDARVLNVCVLGDDSVQQAFSEIDGKAAGARALHVINMLRIRNVKQCHLLYFSGLERNKTAQLLAEVGASPLLTMGEDDFFLEQGGMVELAINDGKINLRINLPAVKRAGMRISSRVLKLATIVAPDASGDEP